LDATSHQSDKPVVNGTTTFAGLQLVAEHADS